MLLSCSCRAVCCKHLSCCSCQQGEVPQLARSFFIKSGLLGYEHMGLHGICSFKTGAFCCALISAARLRTLALHCLQSHTQTAPHSHFSTATNITATTPLSFPSSLKEQAARGCLYRLARTVAFEAAYPPYLASSTLFPLHNACHSCNTQHLMRMGCTATIEGHGWPLVISAPPCLALYKIERFNMLHVVT